MKKTIHILMILFACVQMAGCDILYRFLDQKGAEEKELVGEILPTEKNPTVQEIQTLLMLYGYGSGKADGILGPKTRNMIERFQKDNNLQTTRFADQDTWQKLSIFKKEGFVTHDNKLDIARIQEVLDLAGFEPGKIDGNLGPRTKASIKRFQATFDLKADGKVGYKTLTQMQKFLQGLSSEPPSKKQK